MKVTAGFTVTYIVFLAIILIVQAQRTTVNKTKINNNVSATTPMYRRQEERRKLHLFPKNTMRFVVTPQHFESNNEESRVNLQTKKPLMTKFILRDRSGSEDNFDKIPVTRRPLMKAIDSIIEPLKSKNNANNNRVEKKREISYTDIQNPKDFALDEAYAEEDNDIYDEHLMPILLFDTIMENDRLKRETQMSEKNKIPDFSHPVAEIDRNEFIFVKNEELKLEERDYLTDAPAYVTQDYETTTEFFEDDESTLRSKRHVHIIEEENQATTISGFIYTDRDSKLSNDLLFKNINA